MAWGLFQRFEGQAVFCGVALGGGGGMAADQHAGIGLDAAVVQDGVRVQNDDGGEGAAKECLCTDGSDGIGQTQFTGEAFAAPKC